MQLVSTTSFQYNSRFFERRKEGLALEFIINQTLLCMAMASVIYNFRIERYAFDRKYL